MSKFAFEKKDVHEQAADEQVKHKHVPGVAYDIHDPTTKLLFMIGGGFFNEPRYYDSNRDYESFITELTTTGKISSKIVNEVGLTEQAQEVVETAQAVANGPNPEDLLVIAAWARDKTDGLRLRTTPQIMLTLAAANPATRPFVGKYGPAIMQRADEPLQVFAAYRHLFQRSKPRHKGSLPHSLRKALAAAIANFSEYALLKYDSTERPNYADLLKMVGGSKKFKKHQKAGQTGYPVSKSLFNYLVNGVIDEESSALLKARKEFFALKKEDVKTKGLKAMGVTSDTLRLAGLTWENVISHLGSSKETWELCIPMMAEMALTRNLRNFEQAGIAREAWDKVYEKLGKLEDSVQLPFRWFTAHKETAGTDAKTIIGMKLDQACANIANLPGITVALTDNSGSATGCRTSAKGSMTVADAGNTLMAVLAKKLGRNAKVGVFGDMLVWVPFSGADSCISIKEKIDACAHTDDPKKHGGLGHHHYACRGVGGGTETGVFWARDDLIEKKLKVDRIIIMSDFCCYTQGNAGIAGAARDKFHGKSIQSLCEQYRREVNPDVWVYSINLNGHGQAQTKPSGKRNVLLSGWSEKVFDILADCEGVSQDQPQEMGKKEVPAIEVLRARYKVADGQQQQAHEESAEEGV